MAGDHFARIAAWHKRRFRANLRRRRLSDPPGIARAERQAVQSVSLFVQALQRHFREALVDLSKDAPNVTVLIDRASRKISRRIGVVAPDITRTFVANLNMARQRAVGIDSYVWTTRMDSRVRPLHRRYDGQVFQWSRPPADGHPGQPYGCRCVACGVLERR